MRPALKPVGVYVHFPFCLSRCPYCDFTSSAPSTLPHAAYASAVLEELDRRLATEDWSCRELSSIYFGGGTPSLWSSREIERVIEKIVLLLPAGPDVEITVEANPEPRASRGLAELRLASVNRISFGIQSFQKAFLETLGRRHDEMDSLRAVERARKTGFENVSVDLMYGIPDQSVRAAMKDARLAADTGADHVSAYALTLHPGVPMEREAFAGRLRLPSEDLSVEMEDAVMAVLQGAGFRRYEISNLARAGKKAVHNTGYWTGREYLGLGAGAHGFHLPGKDGRMGGRRHENSPSPDRYLDLVLGGMDPTEKSESLEPAALLRERLFLGMRLLDGVDLAELAAWSGIEVEKEYAQALESLEKRGLVERIGTKVRPTSLGLRFNDTIAADIG